MPLSQRSIFPDCCSRFFTHQPLFLRFVHACSKHLKQSPCLLFGDKLLGLSMLSFCTEGCRVLTGMAGDGDDGVWGRMGMGTNSHPRAALYPTVIQSGRTWQELTHCPDLSSPCSNVFSTVVNTAVLYSTGIASIASTFSVLSEYYHFLKIGIGVSIGNTVMEYCWMIFTNTNKLLCSAGTKLVYQKL